MSFRQSQLVIVVALAAFVSGCGSATTPPPATAPTPPQTVDAKGNPVKPKMPRGADSQGRVPTEIKE